MKVLETLKELTGGEKVLDMLISNFVYEKTGDAAVKVPEGFQAGSLDFASSPLAWVIFHLTHTFKWIGASVLVLITLVLMFFNRRAIVKSQK